MSERITDTATFCRMIIHGPKDLLVDLALGSPPGHAVTASFVGPTFAPEELAGRKLLALQVDLRGGPYWDLGLTPPGQRPWVIASGNL